MEYQEFLEQKIRMASLNGLDCKQEEISPVLKPHQRDIVQWAIRGGQRAIFAQFGLGKSLMQLEIMRLIHHKTGGKTLIVCPLGVRQEFTRDSKMLGMSLKFVRRPGEMDDGAHYITNYESVRDGKLPVDVFTAVSLDEASILRSYGSKTYQEFLEMFPSVPYKFVATATPSPNRYKEHDWERIRQVLAQAGLFDDKPPVVERIAVTAATEPPPVQQTVTPVPAPTPAAPPQPVARPPQRRSSSSGYLKRR